MIDAATFALVPGASFTTLESIERQAVSCERAGSALYASLLAGLVADHAAGGVTAQLLEGVSDRPLHDAVPLRYLATGHRLALAGDAPLLAEVYPSCGGTWSGDDITTAFLATVAQNRQAFVDGLQHTVQTNEVGRAVVLTAGFSAIATRHGSPLRTLEIGASAGLLSRWPSFHYDSGESVAGDPDSPVRFGPEWFADGPLPPLSAASEVCERAACDVSPIDATTEAGRLTMLSFLWPDQLERFDRLSAALAIAVSDPISVDAADASDWLEHRLAATGVDEQPPVATVVFHSIVWQYMSSSTKDAVRHALSSAGARASAASPLCWLRMEPATAEHADLRLTTWTGADEGHEELLAHVGYHGSQVAWAPSNTRPW